MKIRLFETKEELGIGGEDLLTRPMAKKFVPGTISKIKLITNPAESVEFNFAKIKTSDTSFIDELIIVSILQGMKSRKIDRRGIFVSELSPSTFDNMNSVFGQKKVPLILKKDQRDFQLLGHLEKHLVRLLISLMSKESLRAVDVVKEFGFTISVASTKLSKLYKLNLANRIEEISEKGREYNYVSLF